MSNLKLTSKEADILSVIVKNVRQKGYPPSVREIGDKVGLRSSSTVHGYLKRLEKKGIIRRDPAKPRAIEILLSKSNVEDITGLKLPEANGTIYDNIEMTSIPILGRVAAGVPLLAVENREDTILLPKSFTGKGEMFMLRVRGESMIDAGILEGDLVLVRRQPFANNGDIVVALIEDEATVKRFYKEKDHIRLQPENKNIKPIKVKDAKVLGKVIGLYRKFN